MRLDDFLAYMEQIAPAALAEPWDNPGLLISPEREDLKKILVALDCTPAVAREAAALGCDMVLTHHPLFFSPVKRILRSAPDTAAAWTLIRHGIGLFAAHTNLDSAAGGVNDVLSALMELSDVQPFPEENGMGRVGTLKTPLALGELGAFVERALHTRVRMAGDPKRTIRRVAVVGGAGGSLIKDAADAGADVLLTGEMKHDQALEADLLGISAIVAGHYETESPVVSRLIDGLLCKTKGIQFKFEIVRSKVDGAPLRPLE